MSDFTLDVASVPTKVRKVELYLTSTLTIDTDEVGNPVGSEYGVEELNLRAKVEDQNGAEKWVHTVDYQKAIDIGVLTAQEALQLRDLIIAIRTIVEGKVLPAP